MLDERGQLAVLAAIGIEVYRLRALDGARATESPATLTPAAAESAAAQAVELVVACSRGGRADRRLRQVLRALGRDEGAVAWIEGGGEPAGGMPDASAYLLVGAAARSCSARLPLSRQDSAAIAVIGDPAASEWTASAKRVLWQALKPLARRLRGEAG